MKQKASQIARKLLNLYRQAHVIIGGWGAVNEIFVRDADEDVLTEMMQMPTGKMLARHIQNLRSGKTPMDTIDRELMPYGGMMTETVLTAPLSPDEMHQLENAIFAFTPDQAGLDALLANPVVRKFNEEWIPAIRSALAGHADLTQRWNTIIQTYQAYRLWNMATNLLTQPLSERERAQIQADMPEYETYLPMFGDAGNDLLAKLRMFISAREPIDTDNAPNAPTSI